MMEKSKFFFKHFFVIGSGTLLNMLVGFITTPVITRLVGTEEYGQYSIFTMYSSIALMVLCMGFDQALIRYFYKEDTLDYQRTILRECCFFPVIASVGVGLIINLLCFFDIIRLEFDNTIVALLTVCVVFQIINRIDLIMLRVAYKTKLYSMVQVAYKVLFALLSLVGCLLFNKGYFQVLVVATVLSYGIVTVLGISAQWDTWKLWKIKEKYTINRKELYKYAFPFVISMGITTFFQAADKIALNKYCSYSEVGIYSSAMTLVHIFAIVQTTFCALWTPMVVEHYEKEPMDKSFYQKGNQLITFAMFLMGISLIFVKDIFALLLGNDFREAAYILPFLCFNPIMLTISETTVIGITLKKKSQVQIIVAAVACLTNIIGNAMLVPIYKGRGAAIATGMSYIVFFLMRTVISNHFYPVDWGLPRFWIMTGLTVIYAMYNTFSSFGILTVIMYVVLILVLCMLYQNTVKNSLLLAKKKITPLLKKGITRKNE